MDMIEKCAIEARTAYAERSGETPLVAWEKSRAREEWLIVARAVVEAIREPSRAMYEAGVIAADKSKPIDVIWQAMIDTILNPST